jgi:mutator protein MutT
MARSAAIIIQENQIALIKRNRGGQTYFVFPGGGVEDGETPEEAVVREIREELGLEIQVDRPIVEIIYRLRKQYFYLVKILGGTFGTGIGPEMIGEYPADRGTYQAVWMPIPEMKKNIIYPTQIVDMVIQSTEKGWSKKLIIIKENV